MGAWVVASVFCVIFVTVNSNVVEEIIRAKRQDAIPTKISPFRRLFLHSATPLDDKKLIASPTNYEPYSGPGYETYSPSNYIQPYQYNEEYSYEVPDDEFNKTPEKFLGDLDGFTQYKASSTFNFEGPKQIETIDTKSYHKEVGPYDVSEYTHHEDHHGDEEHAEVHYHQHKHVHKHNHKQEHVHKHKGDHQHHHGHKHDHSGKHEHSHHSQHKHEHNGKHSHEHKGEHDHKHQHGHHHSHQQQHKHSHHHKQEHKHDHHHGHKHSHHGDHKHEHHSDHKHGHKHDHHHSGDHKHSHHESGHHQHHHGHKHYKKGHGY